MKIGIQNFQGITDYQEIELAPLTLIYGPNSAGKSTLVDAMSVGMNLYQNAHNAMPSAWHARHNADAEKVGITTLLEFSDIQFCNQHFEMAEWMLDSACYEDIYDTEDVLFEISKFLLGQNVKKSISTVSCKYGWQFERNMYRISFYEVVIDSVWVFRWNRYKIGKLQGSSSGNIEINKKHPLMRHIKKSFDLWGNNKLSPIHDDDVAVIKDNVDGFFGPFPILLENAYDYIFDSIVNEPLPAVIVFFIAGCTSIISGSCEQVIVPPIRPVDVDENGWPEIRQEIEQEYLSDIPPTTDRAALVAEAFLKGNGSPADLERVGCSNLDYWNEVLASPLFLDTGFKLTGDIEINLSSQALENLLCADRTEHKKQIKESATIKVTPRLFDCKRGCNVAIHDVGVGMSQLVPVVVASSSRHAHIQQPELHLHPKIQPRIADVFIQRLNSAENPNQLRFLLETHSELLVLRVLRRIRETCRADIKSKRFALTPDLVSVLYVDRSGQGVTTFKRLRISPEGEFLDRWPDGFFAERDAELFDDE